MSVMQIDGMLHYIGHNLDDLPCRGAAPCATETFLSAPSFLPSIHLSVDQPQIPNAAHFAIHNCPNFATASTNGAVNPFQLDPTKYVAMPCWIPSIISNTDLSTFAQIESQRQQHSPFQPSSTSYHAISTLSSSNDLIYDADSPRWNSDTEPYSSSENDATARYEHGSELVTSSIHGFGHLSDPMESPATANARPSVCESTWTESLISQRTYTYSSSIIMSGDCTMPSTCANRGAHFYDSPQMFCSTLDSYSSISHSAPVVSDPQAMSV